MADVSEVWVWTAIDDRGEETFIVAQGVDGEPFILQRSQRAVAEAMRPAAEEHRRNTGHRIRLVRFSRAETVEDLP
ncbi:MAG TPA: hypothetical protein VJ770_29025 [Stellaceae bacterium]|nr:hypothetical protein [Stellaceae bacterium]